MRWFRRRPAPALPTFLVIGAMKCGTSSLHRYLDSHPEIAMSTVKETDWFLPDTAEDDPEHDLDWYRSLFDGRRPVRGETSPNYAKRHLFADVPARAHDLVPGARLVYVVRDPVARARSHFLHAVASERRSLDDVEKLLGPGEDGTHVLDTSRYHFQLLAWLSSWSLDDVLVVAAEDLWADRRATLAEVFRFLGVDDGHDSSDFDEVVHVTADKFDEDAAPRLALSDDLVARMADYLAADAEALRTLTGRPFSSWSV